MNRFYVTTSIAYVNAPPHIGFALESVQADVLARAHRQKGDEVFFLTGTDEHGAKIARAAEKAGQDPAAFADLHTGEFKKLKSILNLSWDNFVRTSDRQVHWPVVQEIWKRLEKRGDIYKKNYRGLYCVGHEAFVTQKDLVDGKCSDHGKAPELIEEENWFFKLSNYSAAIREVIESGALRVVPETRGNEIRALLNEGLEDISFSRPAKDLPWGVPVPGDSTQTMYVWADALSNYISGYGGIDEWQTHPADVHVIGKDILRFHAAIWPAILLSAELPLPKAIYVHGHILSNGQKMSKTLGNVVDPFALVERYGADAVRYYLLREIPSQGDGDFSETRFNERYEADLANGIGNFAARVLTLGSQYEMLSGSVSQDIAARIAAARDAVAEKVKAFRLHEALAAIGELIAFGDGYVNEKKPWEVQRSDGGDQISNGGRANTILELVVILDAVAEFLAPFLPGTADKIAACIEWKNKEKTECRIKKGEVLFPRLR